MKPLPLTSIQLSELANVARECVADIIAELGVGHREKVYECAMMIALVSKGYNVQHSVRRPVSYRGVVVGLVEMDILLLTAHGVALPVELKIKSSTSADRAQLRKYMRLLGVEDGLLVTFDGGDDGVELVKVM